MPHINLTFANLLIAERRVAGESGDSVVVSFRATVPSHGIDDTVRTRQCQHMLKLSCAEVRNVLTCHHQQSYRQEQERDVHLALPEVW